MAADSPRNRGQQPAWRAAAGTADERRGSKYKWKPDDAARPGTGRKRFLKLLVLGGTLATLGAIVWVILWLRAQPQPCLIAISANPAEDAARLDVPLDFYGWETAQELVQLGRQRAEQKTHWIQRSPVPPTQPDGNPLALPETEEGLPD